MQINLRPYQQDLYDKITEELKTSSKVCGVLATGGGKSVLIAKLAQSLKGRTLILTHRIEILTQNAEWLPNADTLTAKTKKLQYNPPILVAMVQTLFARIKKYGIDYIGQFDNIILDEVQILIFQKVFEKYDFKNLIGLTATPVLNKTKNLMIDGEEYSQQETLSEIFDVLVQGSDTQDLIDLGNLVQDFNIVLDLPNFDKLKTSESQPDGYTTNSLNEVYSNQASLSILNDAYHSKCKGKKTIIFNATTKINNTIYKYLKKQGLNVKQFDSINEAETNPDTNKPYTRTEIVEWFKSEKDAILVNTNVFTTGFNVTDVECVIINRATKSLSLWLQMVGRGSRPTTKIFKDFFTVIDLGQNIYEHGIWSQPRDWKDYFFPSPPKLKRKMDMVQTWECPSCESLNVVGELHCTSCGEEKASLTNHNQPNGKTGTLNEVAELPLPKANSIIQYALAQGEGSSFAFKVLYDRIIQLFIYHKVDKNDYHNRKEQYHKRIAQIARPIYFAIIKSELSGKNKKLQTLLSSFHSSLDSHFL